MTDVFIDNTDDISMCAAMAEKPELQDFEKSGERLVLKPLLSNLKYIFLGENRTFSVIVNLLLKDDELTMLMQVLQKNRDAIAWSISDIKGISPQIIMHKILLEEDCKPRVESQRGLTQLYRK